MARKPVRTAFSYFRFSHPEQAKGDSIRRQTALRDAWCERNGVVLDTSLTLADKGISGFTGEHRKNPDRHALASFLQLAQQGRIQTGSFLIVENLDRLSREDIRPALSLFLQLLDHGVSVVQLEPETVFRHDKTDAFELMRAILELSRGHSESAMKSVRIGQAWAEKKKRAAADGEPLTRLVPAWLQVVEGKFTVREDAAETVRLIYRLATDGYGVFPITRKLNTDGVPTIGTAEHWAASSVAKILANPAAMGDYTPQRYKGRHTIVGREKTIKGYFPAVITEKEWYAARAAVDGRKRKRGRVGQAVTNLFSGLLRDATGGDTIQVRTHGPTRFLLAYKVKLGLRDGTAFPLAEFERNVLSLLREIDPRELLPKARGTDEALELAGRLADTEARRERVRASLLETDEDVGTLVGVVRQLDAECATLSQRLVAARQKAAAPLGESWGECQSLLQALDSAPDLADARTRLRGILRRIVEEVWCLFVPRGRYRFAAVQIRYAGGKHRDYLIGHDPGTNNPLARKPRRSWCRSLTLPGRKGEFDLRNQKDSASLAKLLADIPLEKILA